ncbi:MAG: hypothetical protein ACE5JX_19530 [Acidobacteriota bacterium]
MLLIFRYTSDQRAIRKTKEEIKAHLLAVRLFQDHLDVVLKTQLRLLLCTLTYMKHSLRPLAVMIVPILLIMIQLDTRLGHRPVAPGESVLITAVVRDSESLFKTELEMPRGLSLAAPPVRIPERKEVTWKVRVEEPGTYEARVVVGDESFAKQLTVANSVVRLSTTRLQASLWGEVLHPGESPLPVEAPVESIEVKYPVRRIGLVLFKAHWLVPFFGFSLLSGLALKGVLRTEI